MSDPKIYTESDMITERYKSHANGIVEGKKHMEPSKITMDLIKEVKDELSNIKEEVINLHGYFGDKGIITSIKCDTTKHNGRLTKLELWRSYILGGMALLMVMFPTVLAIFIYFVSDMKSDIRMERQLDIQNYVGTAVENYLDKNIELVK